MTDAPEVFRIAYDVTLKRPGCVLLQAIMRCAAPNFQMLFPSEAWLVSPTPDMKVYRATRDELSRLAQITATHFEATNAERKRGTRRRVRA